VGQTGYLRYQHKTGLCQFNPELIGAMDGATHANAALPNYFIPKKPRPKMASNSTFK
jgi:hypothetical protein